MKNIVLVFFLVSFLFTNISYAIEKGVWKFFVEEEYCYIGSAPIDIEMKKGLNRDPAYILVYRINKSQDKIVQITAGYLYDEEKRVLVTIDQSSFDFFSQGDTSWTKNKDEEVIFAMKKGNILTVEGYSSRGNLTKDKYTLKGFTAAFNKLSKDC
ncbi:MAG: hypothetical protein CFH19_00091 [Alphaproteobacteria bacterium MarineAlpha5_Bin9]|nr:MAG: hypothetical protein CFH19_00091 [Alphaproteobacteria bacterium MarineAlpha5_Bin9]|tara:strand:+ start:34462 stop:34926 length:465 start_codon:yes stop_codon:yes gene_type:complete